MVREHGHTVQDSLEKRGFTEVGAKLGIVDKESEVARRVESASYVDRLGQVWDGDGTRKRAGFC